MCNILISVVVCTYNRSALLSDCLYSLVGQNAEKQLFEILIVDNKSTDDTIEVAQRFINKYENIRLIHENKLGLGNARNRGWKQAKGEYVAYTDDDCKLPDDWISTAIKIINNVRPSVFGGPVRPFYNSEKPKWYLDQYGSLVLKGPARRLEKNEFLFGGNFFIRKKLIENLGGFSTALGMRGKQLGYGEETFLLRQIFNECPKEKVFYDPTLYVLHLVRKEKMRWPWIIRYRFVTRRYAYRVQAEKKDEKLKNLKLFLNILLSVGLISAELLIGIFKRDRARYPYYQNFLYELVLLKIDRIGWNYERYR